MLCVENCVMRSRFVYLQKAIFGLQLPLAVFATIIFKTIDLSGYLKVLYGTCKGPNFRS